MKVYIYGKDKRSENLRRIYNEDVVSMSESNIVICPIPFTRDGKNLNEEEITLNELYPKLKNKTLITGAIIQNVKEKLIENNINFIDLMEYEEFSILNAIATSEGAIKKAIEMTDITLNSSNILVLGYGRIGKILAHNLSAFGANIYVEARKSKDIALIKSMGYNGVDLKYLDEVIPKMDIIFNTIPSRIIDEKRVNMLKNEVSVIDLASAPGGVDFEALSKRGINTCWYLGIPSKDSPYTAAQYIKNTIDNILKEE